MTRKLFFLIAGLFLIAILLYAAFRVVMLNKTYETPITDPVMFPGSGTVDVDPNAVSATKIIQLQNGEQIEVPNFVNSNQPESVMPEFGLIIQEVPSVYSILYIPPDQNDNQAQITISLLAEPLGENRLAAEEELRSRLQLSNEQLCQLDIQVWTIEESNEIYFGQDLGLSFCPNSTRLP